jgi:hypothetical protein
MLASRLGFEKQEEELASLYGIELVFNENSEKLAQEIVAMSSRGDDPPDSSQR